MNDNGWLYVKIIDDKASYQRTKIRGILFDESEFEILVDNNSLKEIDGINAWLKIQYHGQNEKQSSITLPSPILNLGHKITVGTGHISLDVD